MENLQSLALAAGLAWASGIRLYAAIFIVGNFGNGNLFVDSSEYAKIVYLAATGRIKRGAVQHDCISAIALERFDHASVEVVEKRIVVVKAVSHWATAFRF